MANEIGFNDFTSNRQHLIAFYTAKRAVSEGEIRSHLEKHLPSYMIPAYFKHIGEMPLTTNGKVDYDKLEISVESSQSNRPKFVEPRNDIEVYLADLWVKFLQLEKVSVLDNFISLGGHSIVAIRILARLESDLNLRIPVSIVFENPTVEELAGYIEKRMEEGLTE
jgi:acyl carrier protein